MTAPLVSDGALPDAARVVRGALRCNPWKATGASRSASPAELASFLRLAKRRHHPDKGGDSEVFQLLASAGDSLLNRAPWRPGAVSERLLLALGMESTSQGPSWRAVGRSDAERAVRELLRARRCRPEAAAAPSPATNATGPPPNAPAPPVGPAPAAPPAAPGPAP
eukprot:9455935-Alexandrium_andersonii.AAC.1